MDGDSRSELDRRRVLGAFGAAGLFGGLGALRGLPRSGGFGPAEATQDSPATADERARAADALRALVAQQTAFALDLHRALTAATPGAGAFHSPLSAWTLLAMLHEGARGATRRELAAALRLPSTTGTLRLAASPMRVGCAALRDQIAASQRGATLSFADALWHERSFALNPAAHEALRSTFAAEASALDFGGAPEAARAHINSWVKDHTGGNIVGLLPDGAVTPLTRLVLTDAAHFHGRWQTPFDAAATHRAPFRRADGSTVEVSYMSLGVAASLPVASFDRAGEPRRPWPPGKDGSTWLELPYAGGGLSFLIAMPDDFQGLAQLERALDVEALSARLAGLAPTRVKLRLPKLALRPRYDLAAPLQRMGVKDAFREQTADLTGFAAPEAPIASVRGLHVTGAFHAAALTVDEAGTEASAASGAVADVRSLTPFVDIDRPFLFFIRERTSGALLFMGRVTDPAGVA